MAFGMYLVIFFIFGALCIAGALNLLLQRHPINSALSLIGVMGSLAVLYLLLGAEFIAAAQVIVYAGAIMVLFIFVIMLLNAGDRRAHGPRQPRRLSSLDVPAVVGPARPAAAFTIFLTVRMSLRRLQARRLARRSGTCRPRPRALHATYLLPFEVTSVLILIAIIGAVVLARKEEHD